MTIIYKQRRGNAWTFYTYRNGAQISLTPSDANFITQGGGECVTVDGDNSPRERVARDNVVAFKPVSVP